MRGVRARAERASGRVLEGMAGADFRARLGVSLTEALIELNAQRHETALSAGVATAPALRRRRPLLRYAVRFRRPIAVGVALLTVGGAGAAASSLWLSPAGNPLYGFNPGLTPTAPPAAQLAAMAVLRRAQADGDRGPGVQAALTDVNNFTTGIRSNYVRVLGTTSLGPVVLVPVQTRNASAGQPAIQNALCVYYPFSDSSSSIKNVDCWSTQQLLAGQAFSSLASHEYGLVPDGVSTISIALGPWTRSLAAAGNFFDVQLPATAGGGQTSSLPAAPTVTFSRG